MTHTWNPWNLPFPATPTHHKIGFVGPTHHLPLVTMFHLDGIPFCIWWSWSNLHVVVVVFFHDSNTFYTRRFRKNEVFGPSQAASTCFLFKGQRQSPGLHRTTMKEVVQVLKRQASASDRLATGWKALGGWQCHPPSGSKDSLFWGDLLTLIVP